ncbi:MAG: hypothetical protein AAB641_00940 [Patescibacteria group bacterium]
MKDLIVCDGVTVPCTFEKLVELVEVIITDLVYLSTFLAVAAFAYAGYILLTSGGNTSARDRAKSIFLKVLIGYVWILAAWLVVYTITSVLLNPGYSLLGAP